MEITLLVSEFTKEGKAKFWHQEAAAIHVLCIQNLSSFCQSDRRMSNFVCKNSRLKVSGILQIRSNAWAIPALTFLNYVRSLLYAPDTVHVYIYWNTHSISGCSPYGSWKPECNILRSKYHHSPHVAIVTINMGLAQACPIIAQCAPQCG